MTSLSTIQNGTESQTASRHATIQELVTEDQKAVVCVKGFRGKVISFEARETKIAHCIVAAKEHGIQNLGEDVVICKKK